MINVEHLARYRLPEVEAEMYARAIDPKPTFIFCADLPFRRRKVRVNVTADDEYVLLSVTGRDENDRPKRATTKEAHAAMAALGLSKVRRQRKPGWDTLVTYFEVEPNG